jgi:hypothetical protein
MTSTSDVILTCRDCGRDYLLDAPTRAWYASKGMVLPRRCEKCRAQRRAARLASQAAEAAAIVAIGEVK